MLNRIFKSTLFALFLAPSWGWSNEPTTRCYPFTITNTPYNEPNPVPRVERWCYQNISATDGGLYLFNADYDKVRAELALVKRNNGTITHGSLSQGKLSMHSLRAGVFNPFPVPLEEPKNLTPETLRLSDELLSSSRSVLALLLLAESSEPVDLKVQTGVETAFAAYQPWRGYWWPNRGQPMVEPLSKYDAFVAARTGSDPGASEWERSHHVSHGLWWEGHCNGWAAASIIRAEPLSPRIDNESGVRFKVSDQKGLLTEADYCANASMFGRRYNGGRDDITDIRPDVFHNTLLYYIGKLKKPVAMDYRRDAVVDNHVVSGYTMQIEEAEAGQFLVSVTLRMHQYDGFRSESPGIANPYKRSYRYLLKLDGNNRAVGGRWLSENPDFIWVPLGPGRCRNGIPLKESIIKLIVN